INVEMPEREHEVLEEERRARHEQEQRQVLLLEAERSLKQPDKQAERDQPHRARQREYQPYRNLRSEQRDDCADQRALDEAEMIVDQEMDVGNEGPQGNLVQE